MTKWRIIQEFLYKKKILTLLAFITGLLYNLTTVLIPVSFGKFYQFNFDFSSQRLRLLDGFNFLNTNNFNHFLYIFIGLILIRFLFEFLNRYLIGFIGEYFTKSLREKMFSHQLQIATQVYESKGIGKYLLRYSGDFKSIQNYLTKGLFKFTQDIILVIMLVVVVAYFDSYLSLIIMSFILIAFTVLFFLNKSLYNNSLNKRNRLSGILSFVNKTLVSNLTIKSFNKSRPTESKYVKRSEKLLEAGLKYQHITALIYGFVPFINYLMVAAVMLYVHLKKSDINAIDQASLLILILAIITLLPIFRRIISIYVVWKLGNISFNKMLNIYTYEKENNTLMEVVDLKKKPIVFNEVKKQINNGAVFKYNFSIQPRSITFIKTDLGFKKTEIFIKLILKIYKTTSGSISIGDFSYGTLTEKMIRKSTTVVSNLFPLYGQTVFEAISYNTNATKKKKCQEILDELQQFFAKEDALLLNSKIGHNGIDLNESQKKMLMWCRAIITNKNILILEKPFEYLANDLKEHLCRKLNIFKQNKIIVFIDTKVPNNLNVDAHLRF